MEEYSRGMKGKVVVVLSMGVDMKVIWGCQILFKIIHLRAQAKYENFFKI